MPVRREAIFFDLDRTLFSGTERLKEAIINFTANKILSLGITEAKTQNEALDLAKEWFIEFLKGRSSQIFDQEGFATFILIKLKVANLSRESLITELEKLVTADLLEEEADSVLLELMNRGFELGIWSQGSLIWQRLKVVLLGKGVFAESLIFISPNKAADQTILSRIPSRSTIVDDRLERLLAVEKNLADLHKGEEDWKINLIWLDKSGVEQTQPPPAGITRITQLNQLLEVLPSLKKS